MNHESPAANSVSAEEREAVTARLKREAAHWSDIPGNETYTMHSEELAHSKIDEVYEAVYHETDADRSEILTKRDQSHEFIDKGFKDFRKTGEQILGRKIDRVFMVPMRSDRLNEDYASESTPFVPLFDPQLGVSSDIRMRAMYGYPPMVLDMYTKSENERESGAIVLAPVYNDMEQDIAPDKTPEQIMSLRAIGGFVIAEATIFAHNKIGAEVIGLGATLPGITKFGSMLRLIPGAEELVTTTGHGGTVHMIVETAKKVIEQTKTETHGEIGVIGGAGSIGWSSIGSILDNDLMKDFTIHSYDIREQRFSERLNSAEGEDVRGRIKLADDPIDVLRKTNLIVCAITDQINLDELDPTRALDLTGKVIIDDSQPGCFDLDQVESRGGKLVWVVGEDKSDSQFVTRDGLHSRETPKVGYNYGVKSGLYGPASEFACGQEAAVIAKYQAYDDAIRGPVTAEGTRAIGRYLLDSQIVPAPWQAFGRSVQID